MSLKGSGQGVDLGTSTLSLILSIFFSFLGLEFPYDPLNLFPLFVFLSPLPHTSGEPNAADDDESDEDSDVNVAAAVLSAESKNLLAAPLQICIIAIVSV
ncbi:hypothetical protein ACET3Z_003440 [Daucus carota]